MIGGSVRPSAKLTLTLIACIRILTTYIRIQPRRTMKAKLTVSIDQDLIPAAKRFARSRGTSLSQVIEDALRDLSEGDGQTFSEQWTGSLAPSKKNDARYEKLARKYL